MDKLCCLLKIEIKEIDGIHLVDQDEVTVLIHSRVVVDFAISFGYRKNADIDVTTGVKISRTDHVADIFKKDNIKTLVLKSFNSLSCHVTINMTKGIGMNLNCFYTAEV